MTIASLNFDRTIDYLLAGLRGVLRHKLRSVLAVMGIVLAIAALLSTLAVGEGARQEILQDMERMGLHNIILTSRRPPKKAAEDSKDAQHGIDGFGLTRQDLQRCKDIVPGLTRALAIHEVGRVVIVEGRKVNARVLGVNEEYFKNLAARLERGRLPCALDVQRHTLVCVIETPIPAAIGHCRDPLSLTPAIGENILRVVGTVSAAGAAGGAGDGGADPQSGSNTLTVYMPFSTAIATFGIMSIKSELGSSEAFNLELNQMILECEDPLLAVKPVEAILKKSHKEIDYEVKVPLEMLSQQQRTKGIFHIVLLSIAALVLLVGGVGIVNIMLVSVAERTKEIGIRRALGARRVDIMLQFLIETLALTMTGGLLGVAAGLAGVQVVRMYTGWPVAVTLTAAAGSFLVSAVAGMLFGLYPARKAASVAPVVALRYE